MTGRTISLIALPLCLFAALPSLQAQLPPANKDPLLPSQGAQGKAGCSVTETSSCAETAAKILPNVMGTSPMEENLRRLTDEIGGRVRDTTEVGQGDERGEGALRAAGAGKQARSNTLLGQ